MSGGEGGSSCLSLPPWALANLRTSDLKTAEVGTEDT